MHQAQNNEQSYPATLTTSRTVTTNNATKASLKLILLPASTAAQVTQCKAV
jgi:hypothetical protein